jgi:hypothetical protein
MMILRHRTWPELIAELRSRLPDLACVADGVLAAVMAAPCATASWIALRAPHLASRPHVSIAIVGAETADAVDQGRWYQHVPLLLEQDFIVEVTLIGPELDTGFESTAAALAPVKRGRSVKALLGRSLSGDSACRFDLAIAFHPGLQKHRGWLERDAFACLLQHNVPLICAAFGTDEYEMERWVAESYGYEAAGEALLNPFSLDLSDGKTSIRWGSVLWQLTAGPADDAVPDQARLAALETLNNMVMHSMTAVEAAAPPYGEEVDLAGSDGRRLRLVHVADMRFADPRSGEIWWLDGGELKNVMRVPAAAVASYPGPRAPDLKRAMWAAALKSTYLLESYPPGPAADSAATAASMLAELKRKLAQSFRA